VAGPTLPTPEAQCLTEVSAELSLLAGGDVRAARDAEVGLRAVAAGPTPLVAPGHALLTVEPAEVVVSALEPAPDGDGTWLRLLNPTDGERRATVRLGFPCASALPVRLDGTPCGEPLQVADGVVEVVVPPHALRTVRLGRTFSPASPTTKDGTGSAFDPTDQSV
jgi:alpha-mannosidase